MSSNVLRTARTHRGTCADLDCLKPILPGQRYRNATRFATQAERDLEAQKPAKRNTTWRERDRDQIEYVILPGGRVPIVLHEDCKHPADALKAMAAEERNEAHKQVAKESMRFLCVNGTVPTVGGRATCPNCEGAGCN